MSIPEEIEHSSTKNLKGIDECGIYNDEARNVPLPSSSEEELPPYRSGSESSSDSDSSSSDATANHLKPISGILQLAALQARRFEDRKAVLERTLVRVRALHYKLCLDNAVLTENLELAQDEVKMLASQIIFLTETVKFYENMTSNMIQSVQQIGRAHV